MKTKNIFKTVAFAMLMPTMLLTTSCSSEDDLVNNTAENTETVATNQGYALPVTVSATRQGDGTRATFNETTRKLEFSAGDKLLVLGNHYDAGRFAGMLDYDTEKGNFSGTIYTNNEYPHTADQLFTEATTEYWVGAALFPNGYETYKFLSLSGSGYSTIYSMSYNKAIAADKATAIEQFSLETAKGYSSGFTLSPENAILNFTITGLTDGEKDVTLMNGSDEMFTGSVTPTSGTAAFALGAMIIDSSDNPVNLKNVILTIGGTDIDITSTNKNLAAGKYYTISRSVASVPDGAISGVFSVSSTDKVYFSKGNLQYDGTNWKFAASQWEVLGANGTGAKGTATSYPMDLFTWGFMSNPAFNGTTYVEGSVDLEDGTDWGHVIGEGWYTLSKDEWNYLFNTRSDAANKYGFATVNGVHGIIILPDAFVDPNKNKGSNAFVGSTTTGWDANEYTAENWALMEAAGAVFLPAAGSRNGASVYGVGNGGSYWSSSAYVEDKAYSVFFMSEYLSAGYSDNRYSGLSVRLVRQVE